MKNKFYLIFIIMLFIISGCSSEKKSGDASSDSSFSFETIADNEKSSDKSFEFNKENFEFTTNDFMFSNFEFESMKDIDDSDALFIYSDFTNTSSEELVPDSVWQQYISITKDEKGTQDTLYPTVLPEKLLKKSDYKSAVDANLSSVKKGETVRVGNLYKNDEKDLKMTIFDDNRDIVAIVNRLN